MGKRGQQEIAGFVIIVVLVVAAAFIFMVLSMGNRKDNFDSVEVGNLLGALWDHTTDCVLREPIPASVGDLIQEAYGMNPQCKDIGVSARNYLNTTIYDLMDSVLRIEPRFNVYQIDIFDIDGNVLNRYYFGNCGDGEVIGADKIIPGKLQVVMRICLDVDN